MTILLYTCAALGAYMSLLFVLSILRGDNGTADIGYGIGFIVTVATALFLAPDAGLALLLAAVVFLWALRLAIRIYLKNRGKPEDFRYLEWRTAWGNTFLIRSFFQIYMLQGLVIYVVALPVVLAIGFPVQPILSLVELGVVMWLAGFFFEVVGDFQLDRFLRDPAHKGHVMQEGLWKYSRHPNYFGESLMWWGIAVAGLGLSAYGVLGFISPILITYLLLKVSGVPMLEKRWAGLPEWEAYKARTSVFFPIPPKR